MNKAMKWTSAVLTAGVLLGGSGLIGGHSVGAAASGAKTVKQAVQQPTVALKYKGTALTQQGTIVNGSTMIPINVLRDSLSIPITYNASTKTYSVGKDSAKLNLKVSAIDVEADVNGFFINSLPGQHEAKMINNRLYVSFQLASDFLGVQGVYNPTLKSLDLSNQVMNDIKITTQTLNKSNKNASIRIQYPSISGLADEASTATVNANFKKQAEKFAAEAEQQASRRDGTIEAKYDFSQTFVVTFNREGVVSIVTDQYSFSGGAHGSTVREGYTLSVKDGSAVELKDLLKANPNFKQTLDKLLKETSKKESKGEYSLGLKASPDFYISDKGLVVFYQQYEINYAAGIIAYTINFNSLLPKGTNPFTGL